jgi:hypothetical protein
MPGAQRLFALRAHPFGAALWAFSAAAAPCSGCALGLRFATARRRCAASSNFAIGEVVELALLSVGGSNCLFSVRWPGQLKYFFVIECARTDCFGACGPSSSATLRTAAAEAATSNLAEDGKVVEPPWAFGPGSSNYNV